MPWPCACPVPVRRPEAEAREGDGVYSRMPYICRIMAHSWVVLAHRCIRHYRPYGIAVRSRYSRYSVDGVHIDAGQYQ